MSQPEAKKVIPIDFTNIKAHFPTLHKDASNNSLVYLDTGSSALRPQAVINAVKEFSSYSYANVHRGVYALSQRATEAYEGVRDHCQTFLNAAAREEIIFTAGTTASINLVATCFGERIKADDEIILSTMEHHSNIVPWQMLCERTGAKLKIIPLLPDGSLDFESYLALLGPKTKLVTVMHVSNILGTVNPIKAIVAAAHAHGAPVLIDGAQAAPRMKVDVQDLNCDFYVFSSHKIYGPTGVGVLYAKRELLETLPPYQGGGDMILTVSFEKATFNALPYKFEAGTPNITGVVGLGAALDFVEGIGLDVIYQHEMQLTKFAMQLVHDIPGVTIYGQSEDKVGVISFTMQSAHPHDVGTILDSEKIAIRAGHHCAMPLMEHYCVPAMIRASLGVYNDQEDIRRLVVGLKKVIEIFGD